MLILCMWLQVINKVKVTHEGKGHIKVKVQCLHPFKFYVAHTLCKRVVLHSTEMLLVSYQFEQNEVWLISCNFNRVM